MKALVIVCTLALGGSAAADRSVVPHGEVSLSIGWLSGTNRRFEQTDATNTGLRAPPRVAFGARFGSGDAMHVLVGAVVDYLYAGVPGYAYGLEGQADWQLADTSWRSGPRLSLQLGTDVVAAIANGDNSDRDVVAMVGGRIRNHAVTFGLDAVIVRSEDGHAEGVLANIGLTGKPGTYSAGVVIGIGVLVAAFVGLYGDNFFSN